MKATQLVHRIRGGRWLLSQAQELIFRSQDRLSRREFARLYKLLRPYTMSSNSRLRGLYRAVHHVVREDIPGDIVECGTAKGGSAAMMGLTLKGLDAHRTLWVFDTFEGLPPPTLNDPDFEIARLYTGECRGDLDEVEALFERLSIASSTRFVKGLFQQTLPVCEVDTIAVLHIDGDWYDSVKVCLDYLYDRVNAGGIVQIDDYGHWLGARKATDEFLRQRSIDVPLLRLDYTGRQFIKP